MSVLSKGIQKVLYTTVLLSLIIPGIIIGFHLIRSGEDSVTLTFEPPFGILLVLYYSSLFLALVSLAVYWLIKQIKELLTLRNEKIKTEILLLKTEVNPHFFFNMLNNLYAMVDKDTTLAKEVIIKLSDMMRYSIYEGKRELVDLEEEVDFIHNYINLHRLRYHRAIDVAFDVDIKSSDVKITPLLFIILVENAFKHGIETMAKNGFVHMKLQSAAGKITFEIKNNFDKSKHNQPGIGLANLKRRLELLYPEKSSLNTSVENNTYYSRLELTT